MILMPVNLDQTQPNMILTAENLDRRSAGLTDYDTDAGKFRDRRSMILMAEKLGQ